MSRNAVLSGIGLAIAVALIALLFSRFELSLSELTQTVLRIPIWVLVAVTVLTFANQIIGVLRWRMVNRALFPDQPQPSFGLGLTATTWGSFLGQFLPMQLAMAGTRWLVLRRSGSVGSTLFEQLVDLVLLVAGATAAALVLLAGLPITPGLLVFAAAILLGLLGMRWIFALGAHLANRIGGRAAETVAAPFHEASVLPARLTRMVTALGLVRLALLTMRMVLVATALVASLEVGALVVGYPIVGLALGLPFAPAGLGVADWSWTGLLVVAGASAPIAALTALSTRVLNFVALLLLSIALSCATMASRLSASERLTA